jgi:hypothetical protein
MAKAKITWAITALMAMVLGVGVGYWYLRPAPGPAVPEGLSLETVAALGKDFLRDYHAEGVPTATKGNLASILSGGYRDMGPIFAMKYECFIPIRRSEIASAGKSIRAGKSWSTNRKNAQKFSVVPCYRLAYQVHFSNRRNDLGPGEMQLIVAVGEGEPVVLKTILFSTQQSYWPSLAGSSKPKD